MFIGAFPSVLTVSQNAFKTIQVHMAKAMALAEMNLNEATAQSITQFNFNFDVLEKLSLDEIQNEKRTVLLCDEEDYERMLELPPATLKTLKQYNAVAWDAEPRPKASRAKAAASADTR